MDQQIIPIRNRSIVPPPVKSSAKATCFISVDDIADINGIRLMAYTDIAIGSPCVVPSAELIPKSPVTKRRAGCW